MKKSLALCLAALMLAMPLASCAQTENTPTDTTADTAAYTLYTHTAAKTAHQTEGFFRQIKLPGFIGCTKGAFGTVVTQTMEVMIEAIDNFLCHKYSLAFC